MNHFLGAILLSAASVFAQIGYSVLDQYYGDVLYEGNNLSLLSNSIHYPGLTADTTCSGGAGFLNPEYYYSNYSSGSSSSSTSTYTPISNRTTSFSWSDLYGWNEFRIGTGKIGVWLGGINTSNSQFSNNSNGYESNSSSLTASGRTAVWFSPLNKSAFKGASLIIYGNYGSSSNIYGYTNTYQGYYSSYTYRSSSTSTMDEKTFAVNANSIFQIHPKLNLAISIGASLDDNLENRNNSSSSTSTYASPYESSYKLENSFRSFSFGASLIDMHNRKIGIGFSGYTSNQIQASNNYSSTSSSSPSGSLSSGSSPYQGSGSMDLYAAAGKRFEYLKNFLYVGAHISLDVSFPIESNEYLFFTDFPSKVESGYRAVNGSLSLPVSLDINLFDSQIYAIAHINPVVSGSYQPHYQDHYSYSNVYIGVSALSLGLRGKVGDRFEFSVLPSLQSGIFVTGLEIKYLIPEPKALVQKEPPAQ